MTIGLGVILYFLQALKKLYYFSITSIPHCFVFYLVLRVGCQIIQEYVLTSYLQTILLSGVASVHFVWNYTLFVGGGGSVQCIEAHLHEKKNVVL